MTKYQITKPEKSSEITKAAVFFSQKWNIPPEAYIESMKDSLVSKSGVPAWFYIEQQNEIIAGLGIIENDFHKRKDLTPNICAVYVREDFQGKGIAKILLNAACSHLSEHNISDVYLITTHTEFYEHCGFDFYGNIEENDGKIYTLGKLIHNRLYNENLASRGVFAIEFSDIEKMAMDFRMPSD